MKNIIHNIIHPTHRTSKRLPMPENVRKGFRRYNCAVFTGAMILGLAMPAYAAGDPLTVVNNLSTFIFGLIRAVGLILLGWGIVQVGLSLQAIGYALLVLFFVIGVMKTCGSLTEVKRPEHALRLFVRFALAKGVISYGMDLMLALLDIVQGVISTIMQATGFGQPHSAVHLCLGTHPEHWQELSQKLRLCRHCTSLRDFLRLCVLAPCGGCGGGSCYYGVELHWRTDLQYADPGWLCENGRSGGAGDDGIIILNRAIPLDNFVRFVYNESTSKGGLTYVHYRN